MTEMLLVGKDPYHEHSGQPVDYRGSYTHQAQGVDIVQDVYL